MGVSKKDLEAIRLAGLEEREAHVWAVLSMKGPHHITGISRETGLHRPAVYGIVEKLARQGLVKEKKVGRRTQYATTGAAPLARRRQARDAVFARQYVAWERKNVPALPEDVQVWRGSGLRHVWDEIAALPKGTVVSRYDGYPASLGVEAYATPEYREAMAKQRIERFVITNHALRNKVFQKRIECASRKLPQKAGPFEHGITIFIYLDKVAYVDLVSQSAYIIKNAPLAAYQAQVFSFLFQALPD